MSCSTIDKRTKKDNEECQKEMGAAHDNTVFVDINCKPMRTLAFVMTLPSRKYNCKLPMNLLNYG